MQKPNHIFLSKTEIPISDNTTGKAGFGGFYFLQSVKLNLTKPFFHQPEVYY